MSFINRSAKSLLLALANLPEADMAKLEQRFEIIRLWQETDPEAVLRNRGSDIRAVLSRFNGMQVTAQMMEAMPNLDIIAQYGAGVDTIDIDAAKARHITVTNTPDAPTADTADLGMGLMLALMRRIVEGDALVRSGRWMSDTLGFATSLSGRTLGIIGMGRIGQAIARRAAAFDMNIVYHGPREKLDVNYPFYADLVTMARDCDVLMAACPGGAETRNIVNFPVMQALGQYGFLVNIARGSVVDFDALKLALEQGLIAGAAMDVYPTEPCQPEWLVTRDNVVLAPHIGGRTETTRNNMSRDVVNNLLAYADGLAVPDRYC